MEVTIRAGKAAHRLVNKDMARPSKQLMKAAALVNQAWTLTDSYRTVRFAQGISTDDRFTLRQSIITLIW